MIIETVHVAIPRKGHPLKTVLERFAITESTTEMADEVTSTLRYEKSVMKSHTRPKHDVYKRLVDYSDLSDPAVPGCTLLRDDRDGISRRIIFDSVVLEIDGIGICPVEHEEPFRVLRIYGSGLGPDSANLVLEEVAKLRPEELGSIEDVNARVDPVDTDVWIISDLGDAVHHTLMTDPELLPPDFELDRDFVADYAGGLCISPRYERLVEAVPGTQCLGNVTFAYPNDAPEEGAAIAETGIGVYLTMTGSIVREHDLVLDECLPPSEIVLMESVAEVTPAAETVKRAIASPGLETKPRV